MTKKLVDVTGIEPATSSLLARAQAAAAAIASFARLPGEQRLLKNWWT